MFQSKLKLQQKYLEVNQQMYIGSYCGQLTTKNTSKTSLAHQSLDN